MNSRKGKFNILAIDGGGIRGMYAAHILKRVSAELHVNFITQFDLITGTSTGSIIAAALAAGIAIDDVAAFYENEGHKVFLSQRFNLRGTLRSKYSKKELSNILNEFFQHQVLADAKTRLLIPATDISNGTVHVFKSPYLEEFVRDKNVRIADAVSASCSAPLYFDPQQVTPYLLSDGGLWANNPALVGLIEATGKLRIPIQNVRLFSVGAGMSRKYYNMSPKTTNWGLARWKPLKLVSMILNLQSSSAENMVRLMLPQSSYVRINFSTDNELSLDDCSTSINDLKTKADFDFTHDSQKIRDLLTF